MTISAFSFTTQDWLTIFRSEGQSDHALPYWIQGLYKNRELWKKHINPALINSLVRDFSYQLPQISDTQTATDGTIKFQIRMQDGLEVETVLIPFHKRMTICLSTQVGCAMNCSFCYTGTQGLKRNLTADEIVGQYLVVKAHLRANSPLAPNPSVVFMGQGEPLHNVDAVLKAIKILGDPHMGDVGKRQMTLSTVGFLPGMQALDTFPKINFALSLHSPFDEERSELIPLNQRFPLDDIMAKLDTLKLLPKQWITFEYLMIKDFNMSERHAIELHKLLGHRKAIMNLIPFNPFPGSIYQRPTDEEVEEFKNKLVALRLRVMVRTTKGQDILAACGQLKIQKMARGAYAQ